MCQMASNAAVITTAAAAAAAAGSAPFPTKTIKTVKTKSDMEQAESSSVVRRANKRSKTAGVAGESIERTIADVLRTSRDMMESSTGGRSLTTQRLTSILTSLRSLSSEMSSLSSLSNDTTSSSKRARSLELPSSSSSSYSGDHSGDPSDFFGDVAAAPLATKLTTITFDMWTSLTSFLSRAIRQATSLRLLDILSQDTLSRSSGAAGRKRVSAAAESGAAGTSVKPHVAKTLLQIGAEAAVVLLEMTKCSRHLDERVLDSDLLDDVLNLVETTLTTFVYPVLDPSHGTPTALERMLPLQKYLLELFDVQMKQEEVPSLGVANDIEKDETLLTLKPIGRPGQESAL